MKAYWKKKILTFKRPSGTSRGILRTKPTYYIVLEKDGLKGIGECSPLVGLSIDDRPGYEDKIEEVVKFLTFQNPDINDLGSINEDLSLEKWPSIRFGLEMAIYDLLNGGIRTIYPSDFTTNEVGIPINGLIWMGDPEYMKEQVKDLLDRGFTCLKMKIGAINFEEEMEILHSIRREFAPEDLILRVDANGAFSAENALEKLKLLSELDLHSIEQPIMAGQEDEMARLCEKTPLDIALDEELIPVQKSEEKGHLLQKIKPQYIIIKPSLVGGFHASEEWISSAENLGIRWWATSALESNIGLNAISQWTFHKQVLGHQGLGTGSLYTNNIESPLEIRGEDIVYNKQRKWNLGELAR